MKEKLTIKPVEFLGDTLMAAQDAGGNIWAGVRWMCSGIGLSEGQIKSERLKIQNDTVLSKGGRNLVLPTNGGNQEVLCLKLEYVPIWLAKISITSSMLEENPEAAKKLEHCQLEAKDVLAAAFLPSAQPKDYPPKSTSAGEVASLLSAVDRPMRAQRSPGYKRAEQAEKLLRHFGLPVIDGFVEPHYDQMMLTATRKEITTTLSFPAGRRRGRQAGFRKGKGTLSCKKGSCKWKTISLLSKESSVMRRMERPI